MTGWLKGTGMSRTMRPAGSSQPYQPAGAAGTRRGKAGQEEQARQAGRQAGREHGKPQAAQCAPLLGKLLLLLFIWTNEQ
jgi:hypothetical protein